MEQETKKANKPMFWVGIIMIGIAVVPLIVIEKDLGAWPIILGFLGIIFIGASKYRPMKQ